MIFEAHGRGPKGQSFPVHALHANRQTGMKANQQSENIAGGRSVSQMPQAVVIQMDERQVEFWLQN
jgi:hypothetical protein